MDPALILGLIILSLIAGLIGSLFGLGGGIIVVPVLTVLYKMETMDAIAISLAAIAAVSAASASVLVRNKVANVRIGLRLEVAAAVGAMIGAIIALYVMESWVLALCFAAVMIYSAAYMFLRPERLHDPSGDRDEDFVHCDPRTGNEIHYSVRNTGTGMMGFAVAGVASALTGVGGGAIKVPIMNVHMGIPMKVATATSSYVIGITAFSGAAVYLLSGVLDVLTAAVVILGAFIGSHIGLRILPKLDTSSMRRYFSTVLIVLAVVMILNAGGML